MSKQYFIQQADYNIWANKIVHGWLLTITDEQWKMPIVSSFNSLSETALHIASAENVWLERLHKVPSPAWIQSTFNGSKAELLEQWIKASQGLQSFVESFDETKLHDNLAFKRLNGEAYDMPYYQLFAHIFNHSTYHRGQLVTMLRQAGFTGISSTDLLGFFRK